MPALCLIGPHGAGKSSLGAWMAEHHGYVHWSVGTLRRLAVRAIVPDGVPLRLMARLLREKAGEPLSHATSVELLTHAIEHERIVLDGFPSCIEHLALMDERWHFVLVQVPWEQRKQRLVERAQRTERKWDEQGFSQREAMLHDLTNHIRTHRQLHVIDNGGCPESAQHALGMYLSLV